MWTLKDAKKLLPCLQRLLPICLLCCTVLLEFLRQALPQESFEVYQTTFQVSAYTSAEGVPPMDMTASGASVRHGTAACGAELTFGTLILFDFGVIECQDRFARHVEDFSRVDRWYGLGSEEEYAAAMKWGVQELEGVVIRRISN